VIDTTHHRVPDPADGLDTFTPPVARRTGGFTLEQWIDHYTRNPDATASSGVAGMLTQEIIRLRRLTNDPA